MSKPASRKRALVEVYDESLHRLRDGAENASEAVIDRASQLVDEARDQTKSLAKAARKTIKRHPAAATAIAAAVGALVGAAVASLKRRPR